MRLKIYSITLLCLFFNTSIFSTTVLGNHHQWLEIEKKQDSLTLYPKTKIPAFPAIAKELLSPSDSLLAKVLAIRNAKHSVDLVTYIFKKDAVGYLMQYELKQALQRGVSIRLLVDATGSFGFSHGELKSLLAVPAGEILDKNGRKTQNKAFVEVRIFNSLFHWKYTTKRILKRAANPLHSDFDPGTGGRHWNRRSHDKYLGIDINDPVLAIGLVGGRNVSEAYHGIPETKKSADKTYHDAEMIFRNHLPHADPKNPIANTIGSHFNHLFYRQRNKVLTPNILKSTNKKHWKKMEAAASKIYGSTLDGKNLGERLNALAASKYLSSHFHVVELEFLTEIQNINREHKGWETFKAIFSEENADAKLQALDNPNSIILNAKQRMARAKSTIHIISPYFFLSTSSSSNLIKKLLLANPEMAAIQKGDIELLIGWLQKDPNRRLRILTNSILTTDNLPSQAMVDLDVAPVMVELAKRAGVLKQLDFRELGTLKAKKLGGTESYGKLHAKLVIIDDHTTLVTTSNGDPRSRKINSEIGLLVHGRDFTADYLKYFEDLSKLSYQVYSPEWNQLVAHKKLRLKKFMSNSLYKLTSWFARWLL